MALGRDGHASLIGQTLGLYRVEALVGQGAMGTVYLARDLGLNRNVALKVLLGSLAQNPEVLHRFHLEAQAAAPLRHPNIVRIYSAGIEGGTPYIAMEYIEGEPLDRFLNRQGKIPWQTAFYIGQQVAAALDCAHSHRVIHRDVKPANILLDKHGHAQLTDFGIANVATLDKEVTEIDGFLGTPHYMSPEQCVGKEVGPPSDLYSLGVTLYLMIAGRLPFDSNSPMALIKSITNDDAIRLNRLVPEIPDDVARLVAHLMAKEPRDRPHTAQALIRTIQRIQAEKGGLSAMPIALQTFMREQTRIRPVRSLLKPGQHPTFDDPPPRWYTRLSWRSIGRRVATIVGGLFIVILAQVILTHWGQPRPQALLPQDVDIFTFHYVTPEALTVRLDTDNFSMSALRWIPNTSAVLAEFSGKPGTLHHGSRGLAVLNPDSRQGQTIQPPANSLTEPYYEQVRIPQFGVPQIVYTGNEAQLDHMILLPIYPRTKRFDHQHVHVAAVRYDEPQIRQVVARIPREAWMPDVIPHWDRAERTAHSIPSPDGMTICLALRDQETGTTYLVERDLSWEDPARLGSRLTAGENPVLPCSVRYSPDGRYLSYMRLTERDQRELMIFDFKLDRINGKPIALGIMGCETAFSPDGDLIALRIMRDGSRPEIRIISAANGMVVGQLGTGALGAEPWHPSGEFLLATDDGVIYAIETSAPHRRMAISPRNVRVEGGASVSSDGRWVAAPINSPDTTKALFMQLESIIFEEAPDDQEAQSNG